LRGEPTGCTTGFRGDVVATAKRDLRGGEQLDGEGGYTIWGKLMPAQDSLAMGGLPIGLAHGVTLVRDVPAGQPIAWCDVQPPVPSEALRLRQEMEQRLQTMQTV
jgi:predicted homoserine dehydrogenase-like protein